MKRLALVGEGKGEVTALPSLAARVLREHGIHGWCISKEIIRLPRGLLVDESAKSPRRPPRADGFKKAVGVARAQNAQAVLVLVDADDDCPASFGPPSASLFQGLPGAAVMAVREYETWILLSQPPERLARVGIKDPERSRDAKRLLSRLVRGYLPTTHQLELTRSMDIAELRRRSRSFQQFVKSVLTLTSP